MAKKEIVAKTHPKQHKVHVTMTNGDKFDILTVWGKEGDALKLDVDTKNQNTLFITLKKYGILIVFGVLLLCLLIWYFTRPKKNNFSVYWRR